MTATFTCLDQRFSVHASDPVMQSLVERLLAPFASNGTPEVQYTVVEWEGREPLFALYVDAQRTLATRDPRVALAHLLWEVNRNVVANSHSHVLLHAAAAERHGRAVLLPAPSGWGKTTAVAALVAAGFGYLTDDVAVLDADGLAHPYPKPIALSRDLWNTFPHLLRPDAGDRYFGEDGFVTYEDLGGRIGRAAPVGAVMVPSYDANAENRLVVLSRAECLKLLVEQSFELAPLGSSALPMLARTLELCSCHRLEYRDVSAAAALVASALASSAASPEAGRHGDEG